MNIKDVDKLINENGLGGQYDSGWYGFKVTCDLYEHGHSNMSSASSQEYCKRIPRRKVSLNHCGGSTVYEKGKQRPDYEPLHCSWKVCPKLKDVLK